MTLNEILEVLKVGVGMRVIMPSDNPTLDTSTWMELVKNPENKNRGRNYDGVSDLIIYKKAQKMFLPGAGLRWRERHDTIGVMLLFSLPENSKRIIVYVQENKMGTFGEIRCDYEALKLVGDDPNYIDSFVADAVTAVRQL